MPITFDVFPDKKYFLSKWIGEVTDDEMLESYMKFIRSSQFNPYFNELADLRGLTIPDITSSGLMELAGRVESFHKEHNITEMKTAVIIRDTFDNGMAKLYESLVREAPENIKIFSDVNIAEEWLLKNGDF